MQSVCNVQVEFKTVFIRASAEISESKWSGQMLEKASVRTQASRNWLVKFREENGAAEAESMKKKEEGKENCHSEANDQALQVSRSRSRSKRTSQSRSTEHAVGIRSPAHICAQRVMFAFQRSAKPKQKEQTCACEPRLHYSDTDTHSGKRSALARTFRR